MPEINEKSKRIDNVSSSRILSKIKSSNNNLNGFYGGGKGMLKKKPPIEKGKEEEGYVSEIQNSS